MSEEKETVDPVEERARAQGWVPKDEFRGPEEKWKSAEEFVRTGEQISHILKERNDKLFERIQSLERKVTEKDEVLAEVSEYMKKTEERAYERAIRDLKRKQLEAVENADTDAYRRAETELNDIYRDLGEKRKEKKPEPPKQNDIDPQIMEEFSGWQKDNPWFASDDVMRAAAITLANKFQMQEGLPDGRKLYDRVTEEIKKAFPHKFSNPKREQPGAVEGVRGQGQSSKKGRSYADLPPEAKRACDKFVKNIPNYSKEDYLANYQWDD